MDDVERPSVVSAVNEGPDPLGTPDGDVWLLRWSDGIGEIKWIPNAVHRAIREPLESRLEAYETAVREWGAAERACMVAGPYEEWKIADDRRVAAQRRLRELSGQPGGSRG